MDKHELRNLIKLRRKEMFLSSEINEISKKIIKNIKNSQTYRNAFNIALYYPLEGEIDLRELLNEKNKNFYLPKCIGNNLFFAKYENKLVKGAFSISEPEGECINPEILDVIYVPALCCNEKCFRLGWGKGFYDRFFADNKISAKKIIVCPECFVLSNFTEDELDYRCDNIITEIGIM